jgi:hypothetical protein
METLVVYLNILLHDFLNQFRSQADITLTPFMFIRASFEYSIQCYHQENIRAGSPYLLSKPFLIPILSYQKIFAPTSPSLTSCSTAAKAALSNCSKTIN